jgi:hypothetical protein
MLPSFNLLTYYNSSGFVCDTIIPLDDYTGRNKWTAGIMNLKTSLITSVVYS